MKKILLILIVIAIGSGVAYFIFWNQDKVITQEWKTAEEKLPESLVRGSGKIEAPVGITVEELEVVSLGNVSDVSITGGYDAPLYDKTVTPVIAMLPDKEFGLMGINMPGEKGVDINLQTTAESLVFMSPYLISNDPELAKEILVIIKKDEKVEEFAKVIEEILQKDVEPLNDAKYLEAFKQAIESVLLKLNDN